MKQMQYIGYVFGNLLILFNAKTNNGSTATVPVCPRFSWNFQDRKIAVWKDTQAQNLLPKFNFTTLK